MASPPPLWSVLAAGTFFVFLVTIVTLSLVLRPLDGDNRVFPILVTEPPTTTTTETTTETTTTTTTTLLTTTAFSTTTPTPTTAPPPLNITCPPDVNVTLGSPIGLNQLGLPIVGGGCAQPAWFFSDQTTNTETNVIQIGPVLGAPILTNFTYWDYDANVGLVLGTNGTITIVDNVFSTLGQHQFPFLAESAKIGIWSLEIYSVTLEGNMVCVIDRLALLSFSVNVSHICGSPLSGHGTHQWTPATAAFQFPSLEITSANTGTLGALFVRMHDDELENGAHTPAFDWIDVEHWTNINFTTSTHIPLRYTISVHDFVYNGTIGNQFVIYNGTLSGVFMNGPIDVAWFQLLWKEPTLSLAAQFVLLQQGALENYTDPAVWVDLDGTMVVSLYDPASGTSKSTARLVNDPLGTLRPVPNVGYQMEPSFVQSWVAKHFYHGTEHLQIKTETVVRLFTAQDGCNTTFCEQIISEIL